MPPAVIPAVDEEGLVTKTRAMQQFGLTERDLSTLTHYSRPNPHNRSGPSMLLFDSAEVHELACRLASERSAEKSQIANGRRVERNKQLERWCPGINAVVDGDLRAWVLGDFVDCSKYKPEFGIRTVAARHNVAGRVMDSFPEEYHGRAIARAAAIASTGGCICRAVVRALHFATRGRDAILVVMRGSSFLSPAEIATLRDAFSDLVSDDGHRGDVAAEWRKRIFAEVNARVGNKVELEVGAKVGTQLSSAIKRRGSVRFCEGELSFSLNRRAIHHAGYQCWGHLPLRGRCVQQTLRLVGSPRRQMSLATKTRQTRAALFGPCVCNPGTQLGDNLAKKMRAARSI